MLDALVAEGIMYLFVSNSDNLGATMDLQLLQHFATSGAPFMMEVCQRTAADKKGGHLARRKADGACWGRGSEIDGLHMQQTPGWHRTGGAGSGARLARGRQIWRSVPPIRMPRPSGKLMLRESAMCPDDDEASFEDIEKHSYFNTNNLWVNLPALKVCVEKEDPTHPWAASFLIATLAHTRLTTQATLEASGGVLALPLIKNKKTVAPRDATSPAVFQLETAMGSAIECFEGATAVVVPRNRFAPVKTTNDLFVLRSDVYTITPAATVEAIVPKVWQRSLFRTCSMGASLCRASVAASLSRNGKAGACDVTPLCLPRCGRCPW
jgi:UTP--glucose-1-phosphate uridylyltransferase